MLPFIIVELPHIENRIDTILNRQPTGTVKEEEESFFPKWSLKNKSRLIYGGTALEVARTIHPPADIEFISQCS